MIASIYNNSLKKKNLQIFNFQQLSIWPNSPVNNLYIIVTAHSHSHVIRGSDLKLLKARGAMAIVQEAKPIQRFFVSYRADERNIRAPTVFLLFKMHSILFVISFRYRERIRATLETCTIIISTEPTGIIEESKPSLTSHLDVEPECKY